MKPYLSIFLFLFVGSVCQAQELRCTVTVNADQIDGSNKSMFQTLQQSISDYINTTRFTDMVLAENERIDCSMMILINSVTTEGMVSSSFQVQCRRPVYETSYSTPILNMKDEDCTFRYQEFDRIEFQPNQFTTNLSALVTYYCYLMIGLDLDSYSRLGGSACFQQCENIVTAAQSASIEQDELTGWKSYGSNKNRYVMVSNLNDEAFKPYRTYFYNYHRLGLDEMTTNLTNARAMIATELPAIREANKARPNAYIVRIFLDAKCDELVSIFQKATETEKKQVLDVLSAVDPTRQNLYDKITKP